ncbi:MAG: arylesterase [Alphaproteobacteria bacterium]|nr:arylesterase [Alphaproteobacteria bacterium]
MPRFFSSAVVAITLLLASWSAQAEPLRLLVFGDSLVAGYGLPQGVAFPDQLGADLARDGRHVDIINGGISGDTTAGGASRVGWSLADQPDAVIVVLGGNDALRGLPPQDMERNLGTILSAIQDKNIPVLLAGMHAPANLGLDYGKMFDAAFMSAVKAAQTRPAPVLFYPFFLDGVALEPELNQDDGIHPNTDGVAVIVQRIRPMVDQLLALARP